MNETQTPGATRRDAGAGLRAGMPRPSPGAAAEEQAPAAAGSPPTVRDPQGNETGALAYWGPINVGARYQWRVLVIENADRHETYGIPGHVPAARVTVYQFRDGYARTDEYEGRWQDFRRWRGYDMNKSNGGLPASLRTRLWDPNEAAILRCLKAAEPEPAPIPNPETPPVNYSAPALVAEPIAETPPADSPAGPETETPDETRDETIPGIPVQITGRTLKALFSCALQDERGSWRGSGALVLHVFDDERSEPGPSVRGPDGIFRAGPIELYPVVCIEATDGRCGVRLVFRDHPRVGGRRFLHPSAFAGMKADAVLRLMPSGMGVIPKAHARFAAPPDVVLPFATSTPELVGFWRTARAALDQPDPDTPRTPLRIQGQEVANEPERMIGLGVAGGFGTVFGALSALGIGAFRMDQGHPKEPIYIRSIPERGGNDGRGWDKGGNSHFWVEACAMPVSLA